MLHSTVLLGLTLFISQILVEGQGTARAGPVPPEANAQKPAARFELDDTKGVVVPFRFELPDLRWIMVQACINNSKPYTFAVDTGSDDALTICSWVQKEINVPLTGKTLTIDPGNVVSQITLPCQLILLGDADSHRV
jgi:hypothetical protein